MNTDKLFSINLDWVQLQVEIPRIDFEYTSSPFEIKKMGYNTRHFKSVYEIFINNERCATLAAEPHSGILAFNRGLLKFDNKFLYQMNFIEWVKDVLGWLKLKFCSISRLDIALDFTEFAYNLTPSKFISNYVSGKILKVGKSKFKTEGEQEFNTEFHYLRFGSAASDCSYYLYNKSKEQREKTNKPWIAESWAANGFEGLSDMWRLEFSLSASSKNYTSIVDGETFNLKDINLLDFENFSKLYSLLLDRYFRFVFKGKQSRKDRMKPVTLFTSIPSLPCKILLSKFKDSTRSSKIFARKLCALNDELRGNDVDLSIYNNELLSLFLVDRNLVSWANNSLTNFKLTGTEEMILKREQIVKSIKASELNF